MGERFTDIDFEAVWGVLKYMFATNLSYELFIRKGTTQPILLKNETSKELSTGDQPVVNTFITGTSPGQLVDDLELYYSVSPGLGVLVTSQLELNSGETLTISEPDVTIYNNHIIQNSHQQLYASNSPILEQMLKSEP